ncbi:MAG: J domain-containing protein [Gemmataceae bacterium]
MRHWYQLLGIEMDSDEETIRARYLELIRQHPPGLDPVRFHAIRQAYEVLRDRVERVRHRLFHTGAADTLDKLIEELACQSPPRRVSLKTLLTVVTRQR